MDYLKATGGRKFTFNGRKYFVQDALKQDREQGKYMLTIWDNEMWKCAECMGESKFFNTIKEARIYVRLFDFMLEVW